MENYIEKFKLINYNVRAIYNLKGELYAQE